MSLGKCTQIVLIPYYQVICWHWKKFKSHQILYYLMSSNLIHSKWKNSQIKFPYNFDIFQAYFPNSKASLVVIKSNGIKTKQECIPVGLRTGRSLTISWSLLPGGCLLPGDVFAPRGSASGGLSVSGGGVCFGGSASGGCLLWGRVSAPGGVCFWGVLVSQHALRQTPPC